ncbi:hypothetical protein [Agrobacterium sp. DSM 25558]|uniref:hypothetical protein n=1 Tax=Agrobacterium sp. DSM 25558 TaxID=1907665 RepID=UPI00190EC458|nr:hypothetical protein [Agrobacterium sp. DSM 25558]
MPRHTALPFGCKHVTLQVRPGYREALKPCRNAIVEPAGMKIKMLKNISFMTFIHDRYRGLHETISSVTFRPAFF